MEKFVKGDVVVVPFPFSDLSRAKRRPACVIAVLKGNDVILCQITSKDTRDDYAVKLKDGDFEDGSLHADSNIRPNRLFTADHSLILYKAGRLKKEKTEMVIKSVLEIIKE